MNGVRIRVEVLSPARLLNACNKQSLRVGNVVSRTDSVELTVSNADKPAFIAVLNELCYNYQVLGKKGFLNSLLSVLGRWGLIAGVLAVIGGIAVSSFFVTGVDVTGSSDKDGVLRLLKENGIKGGMYKSGIDIEEIERLLVSSLPQIAFASVSVSGMTLKIDILEMLEEPAGTDKDKNTLVSSADAVVTRVLTHQGTALVKEGDSVLAGEELIGGYYHYGEGEGEKHIEVRPEGEVYGKVYYHKQLLVTGSAVNRYRTGNKQTRRTVEVFGQYKNPDQGCDYAAYEAERSTKTIWCMFPIKVHTVTYYEVAEEIRPDLYEQRKHEAVFDARQELFLKMPDGAVILNTWNVEKTLNGMTVIDVYIEAEQRIDIYA